jgi:hypothetical protein
MSNWYENKLIITGEEKELEKFDLRFKGRPAPETNPEIGLSYSFNCLVPVPQEVADGPYDSGKGINGLMDAIALKGPFDGHSWRIINWGCKWDVAWDDVDLIKESNKFTYSYITANSSSVPFVANASLLFPDLVFQIVGLEVLSDYVVDCAFQNGKLILDATPMNTIDLLTFVRKYFEGYEEYMCVFSEANTEERS